MIDWSAEVERPAGPPPAHVYVPPEAPDRLARVGVPTALAASFPYHHAFFVRPPA